LYDSDWQGIYLIDDIIRFQNENASAVIIGTSYCTPRSSSPSPSLFPSPFSMFFPFPLVSFIFSFFSPYGTLVDEPGRAVWILRERVAKNPSLKSEVTIPVFQCSNSECGTVIESLNALPSVTNTSYYAYITNEGMKDIDLTI